MLVEAADLRSAYPAEGGRHYADGQSNKSHLSRKALNGPVRPDSRVWSLMELRPAMASKGMMYQAQSSSRGALTRTASRSNSPRW